jgi:hypothetical protein
MKFGAGDSRSGYKRRYGESRRENELEKIKESGDLQASSKTPTRLLQSGNSLNRATKTSRKCSNHRHFQIELM